MEVSGINPNVKGFQRLGCGCVAAIRYGSPLYADMCEVATDLFTALIRSPSKNKRECEERDALRKHIGWR